jgi:hypothetical protein
MLVLALIWPSLVFRSIVRHISPVGRNVDDRAWKHVLDVALHPLPHPPVVRRVRHSLRRVVLPLLSALSIAVALSPLLIGPSCFLATKCLAASLSSPLADTPSRSLTIAGHRQAGAPRRTRHT